MHDHKEVENWSKGKRLVFGAQASERVRAAGEIHIEERNS